MSAEPISVGAGVAAFVARLTGSAPADLPSPGEAGPEWPAVLRQWLARRSCGLVAIANPGEFSWPGHWIGVVDAPDGRGDPVAVLLFGTPSAVISSPDAPELVGRAVDELSFRQGLLLVSVDPFSQPEAEPARSEGEVLGIYVTAAKTGPMRSLLRATARAGSGLEGDRYAARLGTFTPRSDRLRGYDLTLIESEVLDGLNAAEGGRLAPEESRRNIVTRGIALNGLVGREFTIGAVRAFGQRLCEPCVHLQRLTRPGIVAALAHRGGLRADLLSDGEIGVGDLIRPG